MILSAWTWQENSYKWATPEPEDMLTMLVGESMKQTPNSLPIRKKRNKLEKPYYHKQQIGTQTQKQNQLGFFMRNTYKQEKMLNTKYLKKPTKKNTDSVIFHFPGIISGLPAQSTRNKLLIGVPETSS